jgi:glycosyltransferase involved in cell wall biosynthesis
LADVLLVHLNDEPLFKITIPSKVQAYMAAGRPILCAVGGDANDLVVASGGGVVSPPEDPAALVEAILELRAMPEHRLRSMGENGRRFYESKLSLMNGVSRFEAIFRSVADSGRGHRRKDLLPRERRCIDRELNRHRFVPPVIETDVAKRQSDAARINI